MRLWFGFFSAFDDLRSRIFRVVLNRIKLQSQQALFPEVKKLSKIG